MVAAVSTARPNLLRHTLRDTWATWLLLGWLILPPVLTVIESWLLLPIVTLRYLLVSLPPAYLLLARSQPCRCRGRGACSQRAGWRPCACFTCWGRSTIITGPQAAVPRGCLLRCRPCSGVSRRLVVANVWSKDYLDYYFEATGSPVRVGPAGHGGGGCACARRSPGAGARRAYVWYISMHRKTAPELLADLDTKMTLVKEQPLIGG